MVATPADVIQGGALVVLFVFVVAFGAYFRERDKRSEALIQRVVDRALDSMDTGIKVQQTVAESLVKLCVSLDGHVAVSSHDHETILSACRGLSRRALGKGE